MEIEKGNEYSVGIRNENEIVLCYLEANGEIYS